MIWKRWSTWRFIDDFSIVVQGPASITTSQAVDIYKDIFRTVIVSCWENDNLNYIPRHKNVKLVINKYKNLPSPTYAERSNELKQFFTTWNGLKKVNTKYVLKVRSDEYYKDFSKFFTTVRSNPNKLTCINTFFKKNGYARYHISDHLYGGLTERLWNAMNWLIKKYRKATNPSIYFPHIEFGCRPDERFWASPMQHDLFCEQIMCMGYLRANRIHPDSDTSLDIMKANIVLVRLSEMGEFVGKSNTINYQFSNEDDMLWHRPRSIISMDEL